MKPSLAAAMVIPTTSPDGVNTPAATSQHQQVDHEPDETIETGPYALNLG